MTKLSQTSQNACLTVSLEDVQSLRSIRPKKDKLQSVEIIFSGQTQPRTLSFNLKQVCMSWIYTYCYFQRAGSVYLMRLLLFLISHFSQAKELCHTIAVIIEEVVKPSYSSMSSRAGTPF